VQTLFFLCGSLIVESHVFSNLPSIKTERLLSVLPILDIEALVLEMFHGVMQQALNQHDVALLEHIHELLLLQPTETVTARKVLPESRLLSSCICIQREVQHEGPFFEFSTKAHKKGLQRCLLVVE